MRVFVLLKPLDWCWIRSLANQWQTALVTCFSAHYFTEGVRSNVGFYQNKQPCWCNRPHMANSLTFGVQTKSNGNREVPEGLRREK